MTFELHRDSVMVNHHARYLGQRPFSLKAIIQTHTHTHGTEYSTWTTKVVGKNFFGSARNSMFCGKVWALYVRRLSWTNHWSANVSSGHARDVRAHDGRSNSDISHFRRKDFIAEDVHHGVGNADQRFAEHREHDSCTVETWSQQQARIKHRKALMRTHNTSSVSTAVFQVNLG